MSELYLVLFSSNVASGWCPVAEHGGDEKYAGFGQSTGGHEEYAGAFEGNDEGNWIGHLTLVANTRTILQVPCLLSQVIATHLNIKHL